MSENPEEEKKFDATKFLRGLSYLGLILGVFVIWSGVMGLILDIPPSFQYRDITGDHANHFTCTYLIVIGIVMFFKPISLSLSSRSSMLMMQLLSSRLVQYKIPCLEQSEIRSRPYEYQRKL